MFSKAVIVTDLSEPSERFLQCKAGLGRLGVREVVLGVCVRLHGVHRVRAHVEEILKPDLDRCRETLARQGYSATVELPLGDPQAEVRSPTTLP